MYVQLYAKERIIVIFAGNDFDLIPGFLYLIPQYPYMERKLFLIPSTLGDTPVSQVLPAANLEIVRSLQDFVVEEVKTARRFLIRCGFPGPMESVRFYLLNEHSDYRSIPAMLSESGDADLGLISEAGVPAVADPGAALVEEAYRRNMRVIPLAGPSSIIMAMMASGLNGQNFAFDGYLPVKNPDRINRLKLLEKRSEQEKQSQIIIEAPYRNNQLIATLLENCRPGTRLCIAANITLPSEWIRTRTIQAWRASPPPDLNKQPAVFVLQG